MMGKGFRLKSINTEHHRSLGTIRINGLTTEHYNNYIIVAFNSWNCARFHSDDELHTNTPFLIAVPPHVFLIAYLLCVYSVLYSWNYYTTRVAFEQRLCGKKLLEEERRVCVHCQKTRGRACNNGLCVHDACVGAGRALVSDNWIVCLGHGFGSRASIPGIRTAKRDELTL